jgi:hypothetical protein
MKTNLLLLFIFISILGCDYRNISASNECKGNLLYAKVTDSVVTITKVDSINNTIVFFTLDKPINKNVTLLNQKKTGILGYVFSPCNLSSNFKAGMIVKYSGVCSFDSSSIDLLTRGSFNGGLAITITKIEEVK